MRVVSIGDLVTDFYYKNGKLIGINGGMTSHNIIANLQKMGIKTAVFGVCGNDKTGEICIKSLESIGVDVSNIQINDDYRTRCFHVSYFSNDDGILKFDSKKRCPFCNEKKWYESSLINPEMILKSIDKEDILIFDNLNNENQFIIDNTCNYKVIDLGQYYEFDKLSNEEILTKIKSKFTIINFNQRVSNYLIKRFNLDSISKLYNLLDAQLITITKGEEGASFIYKGNSYDYSLTNKSIAIDPTGAGDAFVSSIVYDWIKNDLCFDSEKFSKWYLNSNKITSKVVQKMGSRGHIQPLYRIKAKENICTCNDFEICIRKKIRRCDININNLKTRLINAINSSAVEKISKIKFNSQESYLFLGTGGSFAGAKFASKIINEMYGSSTHALYPRDAKYRNNKMTSKVFLFSYSGTTDDLIESTKEIDNKNKYIITKGERKKIISKIDVPTDNIISYRTNNNKGKERGFLSFEGAIVPAALFLKYSNKDLDLNSFINERFNYWNEFYLKNKQMIKKIFSSNNIINIFYGDYASCAGVDIESKIIESGVASCLLHEKKNFSHGRFINYENLNNKNSIYFKQKITSKYEELLLTYLESGNCLTIESDFNDMLGEFDLLLSSQLLIYYVGKELDIDVSKPKYSDEAMKIYFYKGSL